ncbi:5-oxoprolinase subunit PxpB [Intestinimonas sp. MSJ-38]|uniref:5-oxoprolinase subunit PxpB n=1 Tax=Intestinimonas sp. MSJ-38 TaxID=2841532 RepID=UPI001C0F5FC2|nr:5-oxoprolinase subunit PxpB [Intestinimonas sp. MSJ-38]MBU5431132.1 5-oxoprolinase subunit PxpB [Intestinimonas sp. MSJ-38]
MENVRFLPCGDQAVTVEWGSTIDEHINRQVHAFARKVEALSHPAITEVVPTYRSATVHYRPEVLSYEELKHLLAPLAQGSAEEAEELPVVEIPVCYGGEYGPDLLEVAQRCSLTPEEVIARHTAPTYRIYMLGFTPGFPYLGGMDPSIAAPRRKEPRIHIPAGSVGIAGEQTGVYPIVSPGGWQLIGRTPLRLFDPQKEQPILLSAGAGIRFVPIDEEAFRKMEEKEGGRA